MNRTTIVRQLTVLLLGASLFIGCTSQQIQSTLDTLANAGGGGLTNEEIGKGLKQALEFGISEGAQRLSQENGYYKSPYKILLPEEARKVADRLQNIPGFNQVEETILEKINRGAEDAAAKAKPIFVDAIRSMTFRDALDILTGDDNAATAYLNRVTYTKLYDEFNPVIVNSLDKFNARQYWGDAVNAYNKIPFVDKADPDLDDYVTRQALSGLFDMVEKKEREIRNNVSARTTDLLKRVFARQDG
ncbi:DUF4197 domain-containing protein [Phaeodactylibacter xiamenensis]|jgi:hypothetical protein|uniref:DUF4197 domain-containing protein n=1 Tax=Phaeodactylibacter xiamenensis TaxID=1524460 RepID=A0A098SGB5_9BACT|nr:DUF4197 domain-containing protein [Phaeodactylibacter xiamenensis]KGE89867.1 hypothetical protein IX84_00735 [Phaeodactylibacter xiamenensis]MCR9053601.1 DUF4197 domain-containing protein [bacterium]